MFLSWAGCPLHQEHVKTPFAKRALWSYWRSHLSPPPAVPFSGMLHKVFLVLHELWWTYTFHPKHSTAHGNFYLSKKRLWEITSLSSLGSSVMTLATWPLFKYNGLLWIIHRKGSWVKQEFLVPHFKKSFLILTYTSTKKKSVVLFIFFNCLGALHLAPK